MTSFIPAAQGTKNISSTSAKSSLADLKLQAQSPSLMRGTIISINDSGNAIFTTAQYTISLPNSIDLKNGDVLTVKINKDLSQPTLQILSKNGSPYVKQLEIESITTNSKPQTSRGVTEQISLSGIKTSVKLLTNMLEPQNAILNMFLPAKISYKTGQEFAVTITPYIGNDKPSLSDYIGVVESMTADGKIVIKSTNGSFITTQPLNLQSGSYVQFSLGNPLAEQPSSAELPLLLSNIDFAKSLHLLERINTQWPILSTILQNLSSPELETLYRRLMNIFVNTEHKTSTDKKLDEALIAQYQKLEPFYKQKNNKFKIIWDNLTDEFLQLSKNEGSTIVEIQNSNWIKLNLPFFVDEEQYHCPVYIKPNKKQHSIRFILEPLLPSIGRLQLDCLILFTADENDNIANQQIKNMHLSLRSHTDLPNDVKTSVSAIISAIQEISGIHSRVNFESASYFPIDMP